MILLKDPLKATYILSIFFALILYDLCFVQWEKQSEVKDALRITLRNTSLDNIPNRGTIEIEKEISTGATGKLFSGSRVHKFPVKKDYGLKSNNSNAHYLFKKHDFGLKKNCHHWAVVTTINEPTEAIIQISKLPNWCYVIIGDNKTPDKSYSDLSSLENVFYLSSEFQKKIQEQSEFFLSMPFNSFARKNIGYLFAIQLGARVIFDFDDDNLLTALDDGVTVPSPFYWPEGEKELEYPRKSVFVQFLDEPFFDSEYEQIAFNPHPLMRASQANSWPRGFPIDQLAANFNISSKILRKLKKGSIPCRNVGVIQALCNSDPDNDAIYRMTRADATHFTFERNPTSMNLLVPADSYTPYNAQATTHLYNSFWGLYLPISVPGRVTDIWRSFIVQRIMKDLGLYLVYTPPIVEHERSPHNYLADFQAESDLYLKTTKLLEFLNSWKSNATSLPERINDLWIELYERDYIGINDVYAAQYWLSTLDDIGYKFPSSLLEKNFATAIEQPLIENQPYRSRPYFKVNHQGKTFHETGQYTNEAWEKFIASIDNSKRPREGAILKIILMTMDEWPLIKTWTLFHGALLGFENIYILDGSTDTKCISFLRYARDILGANVLFTKANLNQLEELMGKMGIEIGGSSDLIMKLDTDEFLQAYSNGNLSSTYVPQYLESFEMKNRTRFYLGYMQKSAPSKVLCSERKLLKVNDLYLQDMEVAEDWFKAIYNSFTMFETQINLGGHNAGMSDAYGNLPTDFAILHFHWRCYVDEVNNSKKASLSHGYSTGAGDEEDLNRMAGILKMVDLCDLSIEIPVPIASVHKVLFYARSLKCPAELESAFYEPYEAITSTKNEEFNDFLEKSEKIFRYLEL